MFGATQSLTEAHASLQPAWHLYAPQSSGGPPGACDVWSSTHTIPVTHAPLLHVAPAKQSAPVAQVVLHLFASAQIRLLHVAVSATMQTPVPLHFEFVCLFGVHAEPHDV